MKRLATLSLTILAVALASAAAAVADDGAPVRTTTPKLAPPASLLPAAAKKGRHPRQTRSLQGSYQFSYNNPQGGCQISFLGISNTKIVSVDPPTVYSGESVAQWVYWRPFVWNADTSQDLWYGAFQSAVAYPNRPAVFAGRQVQTFDISAGRLVAGIDVWWYSGVDGWHEVVAWAVPLLTAGYTSPYSYTSPVTTSAIC
jgi:hypothetical protein